MSVLGQLLCNNGAVDFSILLQQTYVLACSLCAPSSSNSSSSTDCETNRRLLLRYQDMFAIHRSFVTQVTQELQRGNSCTQVSFLSFSDSLWIHGYAVGQLYLIVVTEREKPCAAKAHYEKLAYFFASLLGKGEAFNSTVVTKRYTELYFGMEKALCGKDCMDLAHSKLADVSIYTRSGGKSAIGSGAVSKSVGTSNVRSFPPRSPQSLECTWNSVSPVTIQSTYTVAAELVCQIPADSSPLLTDWQAIDISAKFKGKPTRMLAHPPRYLQPTESLTRSISQELGASAPSSSAITSSSNPPLLSAPALTTPPSKIFRPFPPRRTGSTPILKPPVMPLPPLNLQEVSPFRKSLGTFSGVGSTPLPVVTVPPNSARVLGPQQFSARRTTFEPLAHSHSTSSIPSEPQT